MTTQTARVAVYAGSFDPPTFGHLDLVERGASLFAELIVAVGNNPRKNYLFSLEERCQMLADAVNLPNVRILPFDGLLVDFCVRNDAQVILRGLRAAADFELEFQMGLANRDLEHTVETLFLLAAPNNVFVSSSIVKEIAAGGRSITRYVPQHVAQALTARLGANPT